MAFNEIWWDLMGFNGIKWYLYHDIECDLMGIRAGLPEIEMEHWRIMTQID